MLFCRDTLNDTDFIGYVTYLSNGSLGGRYGKIRFGGITENGAEQLVISTDSAEAEAVNIVLSSTDVKKAAVLQVIGEWVKYRIDLKSGEVAVLAVAVDSPSLISAPEHQSVFNDSWLRLEAWLGGALLGIEDRARKATQHGSAGFAAPNNSDFINIQEQVGEQSRSASKASLKGQFKISSGERVRAASAPENFWSNVKAKGNTSGKWMCSCGYSNPESANEFSNCFKRKK